MTTNTTPAIDAALELTSGAFWVQGYSTGGKPASCDRAAITAIIESVHASDIGLAELTDAYDDETSACTVEEWNELSVEQQAQRIAARAISYLGERRAEAAGYDTDGYSCEITF